MGESGVSLVLCTAPASHADALAEALLAEGLVACVNQIGPVRSRYRWQGAIEAAEEVLLVIKTSSERIAELEKRIVALHPYQVPEFLVFPAVSGLPAYLAWVRDSCAGPGRGGP